MEQANESLYSVLVDETEGEASLQVLGGEPGQGIMAYTRLYLWYLWRGRGR